MPELSIVIPTLNEQENIGHLLVSLQRQESVRCEVIVADGGSTDATCAVAEDAGGTVVTSATGRGVQLDAGAAAARGTNILFLHADCRFQSVNALRTGLDELSHYAEEMGRPCAGHYTLRFKRSRDGDERGFRFLERKARLDRKGTAHGDQGILIPAELFREAGGFGSGCQLLAETRLADRLRATGQWLLLSAEISTSARRFEKEGFRQRQVLNAVIMALGEIGLDSLLDLPGLYVRDDQGCRLDLSRILRELDGRLSLLDEERRNETWRAIGRYLCENAWQGALWLDVLSESRPNSGGHSRCLEFYDRYLSRSFQAAAAQLLAAAAARLWFKWMLRVDR